MKRRDRDAVIGELCDLAVSHEDVPEADLLYGAIVRREEEMGTAMEEGIAVPHARLAAVKKPAIFFGVSRDGVEWNAPDGKPAHFIFLILTPGDDYDSQVQILGAIAKAMSAEKTREALLRASDSREIWMLLHDVFAGKHILKTR